MRTRAEKLRLEIEERIEELRRLEKAGDKSAKLHLDLVAMDGYWLADGRGLFPEAPPRPYALHGSTTNGVVLKYAKAMVAYLVLGESGNDAARAHRYSSRLTKAGSHSARLRIAFNKANWLKWDRHFRELAKCVCDVIIRTECLEIEIESVIRGKTEGKARSALINLLVQKCKGLAPKPPKPK